MLFRRIKTHIENENWFAVFIDFLIVVVGVFIGIQVANWNATLKERQKEHAYLVRLQQDFIESDFGIKRVIGYLQEQLKDHQVIITSLDNCSLKPADEIAFQRGIQTITLVDSTRIFRSTYDEMRASGSINIIQNETIKEVLAQTIALAERRETLHESTLRILEHHHHKIMDYVRVDLSKPLDERKFFYVLDFDIQVMCQDKSLPGAFSDASLHTYNALRGLEFVSKNYTDLLLKLEQEIDSRWGIETEGEEQQ